MPDLSDKAQALVEYCQEKGRFCPQPMYWDRLWQMLPDRKQKVSGGWSPPLPLILAAWDHAVGIEKMIRLRDHIQWADERSFVDEVDTYLRSLTEEQWYHGND